MDTICCWIWPLFSNAFQSITKPINIFGADDGILQENQVDIMAADGLATSVARSSAAMIQTIPNKYDLILTTCIYMTKTDMKYKYIYIIMFP